jgi:hypothetical protein
MRDAGKDRNDEDVAELIAPVGFLHHKLNRGAVQASVLPNFELKQPPS